MKTAGLNICELKVIKLLCSRTLSSNTHLLPNCLKNFGYFLITCIIIYSSTNFLTKYVEWQVLKITNYYTTRRTIIKSPTFIGMQLINSILVCKFFMILSRFRTVSMNWQPAYLQKLINKLFPNYQLKKMLVFRVIFFWC